MAMAMLASVTVSMGLDTRGVFMVIFLVRAEVRSWKWAGIVATCFNPPNKMGIDCKGSVEPPDRDF